jgi:hypothetical protein
MNNIIKNNVCFEKCPICKAKSIEKIGDISYKQPIGYGTINITLTVPPMLWKCSTCDSWFIQNIISEQDNIRLYTNLVYNMRNIYYLCSRKNIC